MHNNIPLYSKVLLIIYIYIYIYIYEYIGYTMNNIYIKRSKPWYGILSITIRSVCHPRDFVGYEYDKEMVFVFGDDCNISYLLEKDF